MADSCGSVLCPEVKALKAYEKEVVESFESGDLMRLCGEAVEIGAVSQHVMKSLESMDWDSVPRPRVIRYLLMHVYKNIESNVRLNDHWLRLLLKFISSPEVIHRINHYFYEILAQASTPSPVSSHTMCLAEGISEDLNMDAQPPRPSLAASSTYILERHIPQLTELLVGCAHKWENISIALGLPERDIVDLKANQSTSNCTLCFGQLLKRWVLGGYEEAKAPTLENLITVLSSQFVGLGKEANKLCAINLDYHCDEYPPLSKKQRCEIPLLEIIRQSYSTVVSDGKTTLLEVQAVTSQDSNIQYQWFKDDKPFSEYHESILCINNASFYFKGEYKCKVSIQDVSISSKPIALDVSFSPIKRVLVYKYLSEPEVPEDSWPPAGNDTYINLALIKQGTIDKAGEYGRNTIQGNMDDVLVDKDSIEYEMVFTDLKSTTRLLIEGRPGSGKTTLVHKFSQDWARGNPQLNLRNIHILFLVHLRGFFNDPNVKLRDIAQLYYTQDSVVDTIVHQAEESSGEGFCFILDGLDEYRPISMKNTFMFKLIKRQVLPMAVVIIASRPAASSQFRSRASKHVEVVGFLKEQISEFIEKYPFPIIEKRSQLCKYLEHHPNVHHMCYLPIHAAMVCYLFDVMGSILPRTETEMYKEFTNLTLLRTLKRDQFLQVSSYNSIEDLPDYEKKLLTQICELSFKKTVSSKQVIERCEVDNFLDNVGSGRESLGLITVDSIAKKYGFENLYTFLHLTFQEYLAAYYLSQMNEECQLKELRNHGKKKHMQVVWKFYCGLVRFAENDARLVELMKTAGIEEDSLFGVQCAFESQQSVLCDYVVESGEHGTLSFKGHFLTPSDLTAIGYVMKTATRPVEKLVLDKCKLGREGVGAFLGEAGDRILSVKTLCYHNKACLLEQCQLLHICLNKMLFIETLDLCGCNIGEKKIQSLTGRGTCTLPNLRTLRVSKLIKPFRPLHFNPIQFKQMLFNSSKMEKVIFDYKYNFNYNYRNDLLQVLGFSPLFLQSISNQSGFDLNHINLEPQHIKVIADYLKQQQSHTSLNFAYCKICDDGSETLADGLAHCLFLTELLLNNNKISNDGAFRLSDALEYCVQLQSLNLSGNLIGSTGITAIASSIEHCTALQRFDISHNDIGELGAASLAISLEHLTNITVMNLERTNIGDTGACLLAKAFKSCAKIEDLNVSYSGIRNAGAKALGDHISHCTALQKLALNYNHISNVGAISLSNGLHHLEKMKELNLSYNCIGDEGSEAIARAVAHIEGLKLQIWNHRISKAGRSCIASYVSDVDTNFHILDIMATKSAIKIDIVSQNMQVAPNYVTEVKSTNHSSARVLAETMKHSSYLKVLNLDCSEDSVECTKAFGKVLQQVSNLQTVELRGSTFGAHCVNALTDCLQRNHNLQTLLLDDIGIDGDDLAVALGHCKCLHTFELTDCKIYDDNAKTFALSLLNCNNLQTLRLVRCDISDDGAKSLVKQLSMCSNLQNLCRVSNRIGEDGAKALAGHLCMCSNLQDLDFSHNRIGDDGAKALAEHLHKCSNLQNLTLSNNVIGDSGAKYLAECLQFYGSLQTLKITSNIIFDGGAKALVECMQKYKIPRNHIDLSDNFLISNDSLRTIIDCKSQSVYTEA